MTVATFFSSRVVAAFPALDRVYLHACPSIASGDYIQHITCPDEGTCVLDLYTEMMNRQCVSRDNTTRGSTSTAGSPEAFSSTSCHRWPHNNNNDLSMCKETTTYRLVGTHHWSVCIWDARVPDTLIGILYGHVVHAMMCDHEDDRMIVVNQDVVPLLGALAHSISLALSHEHANNTIDRTSQARIHDSRMYRRTTAAFEARVATLESHVQFLLNSMSFCHALMMERRSTVARFCRDRLPRVLVSSLCSSSVASSADMMKGVKVTLYLADVASRRLSTPGHADVAFGDGPIGTCFDKDDLSCRSDNNNDDDDDDTSENPRTIIPTVPSIPDTTEPRYYYPLWCTASANQTTMTTTRLRTLVGVLVLQCHHHHSHHGLDRHSVQPAVPAVVVLSQRMSRLVDELHVADYLEIALHRSSLEAHVSNLERDLVHRNVMITREDAAHLELARAVAVAGHRVLEALHEWPCRREFWPKAIAHVEAALRQLPDVLDVSLFVHEPRTDMSIDTDENETRMEREKDGPERRRRKMTRQTNRLALVELLRHEDRALDGLYFRYMHVASEPSVLLSCAD
jgi:hypothetical protein